MARMLDKKVKIDRGSVWMFGALASLSFVGAAILGAGCGSTTFHEEGPGQPDLRTYGAVPTGMVGACRRPFSMQPDIVGDTLWEHLEECRTDTPREFVRVGYGNLNKEPEKARARHQRIMQALKEGEEDNLALIKMLRIVREEALQDPRLANRVSRESARPEPCDVTYLLNIMHDRAIQLRRDSDPCAVYTYDQRDRQETCLFETEVDQSVFLSSSWACITRTGVVGKGESCYNLCAFDDYCGRQVSCAAADIDLLMCALGVCLPEADAFSD